LLNAGLPGTFARAEDNSFRWSAGGAQTLRTLTFTGGVWEGADGCWAAIGETKTRAATRFRIL
jgi:hypothetical protein